MAANRVRLPSATVERIATWRQHRSSRGWRPLMEAPAIHYSDDAESLVYLVNAEIIVRAPSFAAARDHWGEPVGASEREPVLVAARGDLREPAVDASEPEPVLVAARGDLREPEMDAPEREPAFVAADDQVMGRAGAPAFSFARRPEARQPATWSARALPSWTREDVVEAPPSSADLQETLSTRKTFPVRTWTAHVPPASAT
ncbi:MAG: hypothetical protein M3252_03440 [Actinomycetota bacterium]|nr:hypothetical protein [Actinomycetota bacterium]